MVRVKLMDGTGKIVGFMEDGVVYNLKNEEVCRPKGSMTLKQLILILTRRNYIF